MGIPVLILFIRTSVVSKFVPNTDFFGRSECDACTLQKSDVYFTEDSRVLYRRATCTLQKSDVYFAEERRVVYRRATCTLQKSDVYFAEERRVLYRRAHIQCTLS